MVGFLRTRERIIWYRWVKEAIYTLEDIGLLRGRDESSLKAVQAAKKVFPGCLVVQSAEKVSRETKDS